MSDDIEYTSKLLRIPGQNTPIDTCGCHFCANEWHRVMNDQDPDGWLVRINSYGMILCPACGNKRCPKATYHGHDCTGSNDVGQALSVYGGFKIDFAWREEDASW